MLCVVVRVNYSIFVSNFQTFFCSCHFITKKQKKKTENFVRNSEPSNMRVNKNYSYQLLLWQVYSSLYLEYFIKIYVNCLKPFGFCSIPSFPYLFLIFSQVFNRLYLLTFGCCYYYFMIFENIFC